MPFLFLFRFPFYLFFQCFVFPASSTAVCFLFCVHKKSFFHFFPFCRFSIFGFFVFSLHVTIEDQARQQYYYDPHNQLQHSNTITTATAAAGSACVCVCVSVAIRDPCALLSVSHGTGEYKPRRELNCWGGALFGETMSKFCYITTASSEEYKQPRVFFF